MTVGNVARMVWGDQTPTTSPADSNPAPTTQPVTSPTTSGAGMFASTGGYLSGLQSGMTQRDTGDGRYEILDDSGNSLGYGYKGVGDAISEIGYKNASSQTTSADGVWTNPNLTTAKAIWSDGNGASYDASELDKYWDDQQSGLPGQVKTQFDNAEYVPRRINNENGIYYEGLTRSVINDPTKYSSEEEINSALHGLISPKNYNGVMGDWEALGQVLNGSVSPTPRTWGNLPTNGAEETVSGTNTLFGSTPVFSQGDDGKYQLVGYKTDLSPQTESSFQNGADTSNFYGGATSLSHRGDNHSWANAVWRDLGDQSVWQQNTLMGQDGNTFIPVDNAGNLSWTNKESYNHQDTKKGLFQKAWEATSIGHNVLGMDFKDAAPIGEAIGNIAGAIWSGGIPWGSIIMAADGYTKGDEKAGNQAIVRAGLSYAMTNAGSSSGSNPAMSSEAYIDSGAMGGTPVAGSAYGNAVASNAAASAAAQEAGLSGASNNVVSAIKDFGQKFNSLSAADFGINTGNSTVDKLLMNAGKSALKSAIQSGANGAELDNVFKSAVQSAFTSLVGGSANAASGGGLLGTVAGTVASSAANAAINQATSNDSSPTNQTAQTPSSSAAPTSPRYAGSVSRMIWS